MACQQQDMAKVNVLFDYKVTRRVSAINLLSDALKVQVKWIFWWYLMLINAMNVGGNSKSSRREKENSNGEISESC